MSRINDHRRPLTPRAGFTLVELMVALSLSAIVFAGILAAYLFLGRNLTRLVNLQQQEMKTRRTMRVFAQDVGAGSQLTTANATISSGAVTAAQFVVTVPLASGNKTVTYAYSSSTQKLTRLDTADSAGTQTVLSDLTNFTVNYFTASDLANAVSYSTSTTSYPTRFNPSTALSVKAVEFQFTSSVGSSASGTRGTYSMLSPRVALRNKAALQ